MAKRNKLHKLPYDKRAAYLKEKEILDKQFESKEKKNSEDNNDFWQNKIHVKGD
jgi:hypothetical protein